MTTKQSLPPAGVIRRLAALLYDGIIVLAIEMFAAGLIIAILEACVALGVMTYGSYQDPGELLGSHPIWSHVFTLYLGVIWIGFFVYFWTKAGQTVGMRTWKLRVQNPDGSLISRTQALIRIGTSGFGLANLLVPFDLKKRGFHDIWAKTEVVVLPKVY
ncbi:RDD family protein [Vibrio sp. F74]|uniref:RDD family protein n=1 Tax=Vibrio sp. F74 TaxID=700020 RepID=UPI0035F5A047